MLIWCNVRRLPPTRRRFVNWLNKAEKPMSTPAKPEEKLKWV